MKTALWETSAGALVALLNARGPLQKADLFTLTLAGGTVFRWSGSDVQITGGGNTWVLGPGIQRSRVRFVIGVEVDTLTVTFTDIRATLINGLPLIRFIAAGGLTGARLQLDRAFWAPGDTAPRGALLWFIGNVSEVPRVDRYEAQITVKSPLEQLDAMVPGEVYQGPCLNTLYDDDCGADRAAKTVTGLASGGTDSRRLTFSHTLGQAAGYFNLGTCTFTAGANAGVARTVKLHASGALTVLQPWPAAVVAGDAFSIVPGCNKMQGDTNGCPKFHTAANVKLRFRGQPYVPGPETAL